ncbi:MAG: peptidase S41, partial [Chloroflexus sp.]|nr:peptidase S41 [Chloroflexus sp.]
MRIQTCLRYTFLWLLVVVLVGCSSVPADDTPEATSPVTASPVPEMALTPTVQLPLDATLRQQIFTEVWTTINEHYLDP